MKQKERKRKAYTLTNPAHNRAIARLLASAGGGQDTDLLAQMMTSVMKMQGEKVDRGELKLLNSCIKEWRWAFKVFRPYRHVRKVSLFGSARTQGKDCAYKSARKFAQLMAKNRWMVITGASTGIMGAGNEGAGREFSFGVNIRLPAEQDVNPHIVDDRKLIHFRYFFTRKLVFVKESDAICLYPGGFGTLDEGFEVLTLVQTGKATPRPIVLVEPGKREYWRPWLRFVKQALLRRGMISPEDMDLMQVVSSAEEACRAVLRFFKVYHSCRFVGDRLVLRLQKELRASDLNRLNRRFKDLLLKGSITPSGPLAAETNEPEASFLPRLVFHFDRKSFGRLKQMIDAINEM